MLKTATGEKGLTHVFHENSGRKSSIKLRHCFFIFCFVLSCMTMNALCGETSTFKNPAAQILQLQKGWNLCALTIAPDADSIALLNNHGVCWGWENGHFKLLESFLPWQGFWTYSDENVQLTLTGEEAGSTPLHLGWNLVGIDAGIQEKLSRDGLHAWRYDQNSYQRIHDAFTPGLGYWIFKPSVIKPRISYTLVPTDGMWCIDGGDWNNSGFVATTEVGAHTISFQAIDGYTTPADETVTLAEGEKLSKNVEYAIIPPTVTVTLNPASGKWRLDNGDWNDSGFVVTTEVGTHTISFQAIDGYTTPVTENVTLAAGKKLSKTVDYEVIPPTVAITLNPPDGKWRIDNGDWNDSGSVATTEVGAHTISFQAVDGYTAPADETVTLAAGEKLSKTVEYAVIPPTVTVTLNPLEGKWRIDNGEWNDSGATVTTTVGSHTISFQAVDGYTTPSPQSITLTAGQKMSKSVDYTPIQPTVSYALNPTGGKWRIDDGEWNKSGATVTTTAGEHTVSFQEIDGYTTPAAQTITLKLGERLSENVTYKVIPPTITYTLNPTNGKWRIDDGEWNDSGATVTTTVGSHTISFQEINGYNTPTNQNLSLAAGKVITRTANYTVIQPTVCYTLTPAIAKWRIDSGSWNDSGFMVTTTIGNHKISFQAVDGYTTPAAQNITLVAGENLSQNIEYEVIPPTVTYTLNPPIGKWRLDNSAWNDSGTTVTTTVGKHTVSFNTVAGYKTPDVQNIVLAAGEKVTKVTTYEAILPTVTYTLNPPNGQWRLDDGEWLDNGITVTTTIGEHKISFKAVTGYSTPSTKNIILDLGQNLNEIVDYGLDKYLYAVVDLSPGPDAEHYPVRYTDIPPDLNDDKCRTTELWLRKIYAGTFIMGSPEDEEVGPGVRYDDETQHEVTLTQDYYIGIFECTQKQWELVMGNNPSNYKGECRPVDDVSYFDLRGKGYKPEDLYVWPECGHKVDSKSFLGKLYKKTGMTFDLPTSAQWEYACRAGTTTALNSGQNLTMYTIPIEDYGHSEEMDAVGRYLFNKHDGIGGYERAHTTVGSYLPNAWGLYDMHGNVAEWCLDWYSSDPVSTSVVDPVGPAKGNEISNNQAKRVIRGGDYDCSAGGCRSACIGYGSPDGGTGFRVFCVSDFIDSEAICPTVTYTLNPSNGKWRMDNGDWNDSGSMVTTTIGPHKITFQAVDGYITPVSRNISLGSGANLLQNVVYEVIPPTITYTLNPLTGKWRLDNGDWNDSGVTVTTTVGKHTVSFKNISGYFTPATQNITLKPEEIYNRKEDYILQYDTLYLIVDLSSGPDSDNYPVRGTDTPPNLNDDTCRTTELWLRRIPAGTFIMGSPEEELGNRIDETQHKVTLTQDYFIGVFECTQKQYELVMDIENTPVVDGYEDDCCPVELISYDEIRGTDEQAGAGWPIYGHAVDPTSFMGKLQAKTGFVFDLPTEAQWEYACRAGTTTAFNSGKNLTNEGEDPAMNEVGRYICNYDDGKDKFQWYAKVGSYLPNAWGLYDMHGNVSEWCLDWYSEEYGTADVVDPVGVNAGRERVRRGGKFNDSANKCRSARRLKDNTFGSYIGYGFRIFCLP